MSQVLQHVLAAIGPASEANAEAARNRVVAAGAGVLERLAHTLGGAQHSPVPRGARRRIVVAVGDHGCGDPGLAMGAGHPSVIATREIAAGTAALCQIARSANQTPLVIVDAGAREPGYMPDIAVALGRGPSRDLMREPAMTIVDAVLGLEAGIALAISLTEPLTSVDLPLFDEMAIGTEPGVTAELIDTTRETGVTRPTGGHAPEHPGQSAGVTQPTAGHAPEEWGDRAAVTQPTTGLAPEKPAEHARVTEHAGVTQPTAGHTGERAGVTQPTAGHTGERAGVTQPTAGHTGERAGVTQPTAGHTGERAGVTQPTAGHTGERAGVTQPTAGHAGERAGVTQPTAGHAGERAGVTQPTAGHAGERAGVTQPTAGHAGERAGVTQPTAGHAGERAGVTQPTAGRADGGEGYGGPMLDAIALGAIGVGAEVASAALFGAISGEVPGGLDDDMAEAAGIRGLQMRGASGLEILAMFGGSETAVLAGLILGAASMNVPVILDSYATGAAALVAAALAPPVTGYLIAAHRGTFTHPAILAYLGLQPIFEVGLGHGEGTGAAMVLPLLDQVAAIASGR